MIIKQGGNLGVGVDTGRPPAITYDGKWSGWYVETYGGKAYWEAVFYTSGVLTVEGEYNSDWWGIGGGSNAGSSSTNFGGRGSTAIIQMIITGELAVTIGAGANGYNANEAGGNTKVGTATIGGGGAPNSYGGGHPYRFGDPDKACEEGESVSKANLLGEVSLWAEGGWLHWGRGVNPYNYMGGGYGAGSHMDSGPGIYNDAHEGVAICRIEIK